MSKVKKLFAIVLSLAMILGMSITTFAAETTNVTVTVNNEDTAELYYDQIVLPDTSSTSGWKYDDDYAKFFTNFTIDQLLDVVKKGESGSATEGTLTSSAALANILENLKSTVQVEANKLQSDSFRATSGGLYVVIPVKEGYTYSPTLVYVPVNETSPITVQTKGSPDQITKSVDADGQSVSAGDVVRYEVKVEYPYISANYTNPTFRITDTLTNATLKIDDDHQIAISGIENTNYTISGNNGEATLIIDFSKYDRTKAGTEITISYYVTVSNTVSAESPLQNKVTSELTLTQDGDTTKTEYIVISHPVKATINKVDADTTNKKLDGSVFAIYEGNVSTGEIVSIIADAKTTDGITLPDEYASYTSLLKADGNPDGNITFDGLDGQKNYYVVEIIAPAGYAIDGVEHQLIKGNPIKPTTSTSTVNGVTTITKEYKFNDFKVTADGNNNILNTKLSSLPSTGGIGTTIFTIGGCVIMIAAAGLYFASRRRQENK